MVNRCKKDSAGINISSHAENGANRNLQVTAKPEVLQASLGPTNLQDNSEPIENISTEALQIFHQNIQGLRWKSIEVLNILYPSFPHILCFTEHHLNQHEIELIQIDSFTLGASEPRGSQPHNRNSTRWQTGGSNYNIAINRLGGRAPRHQTPAGM